MSDTVNTCYAMHWSEIMTIDIDLPCGVANSTDPATCCVKGDTCLSHSLCMHTTPDNATHYYNADCTDPTMEDPICGTRCGGRGLSDLVYNEETGFWACCWNRDTEKNECGNPSKEIYPAPAPSELSIIQSLPSTTSGPLTYLTTTASVPATASASASSTETNTAVDSPSSATQSSSGVSAGAAAGIGVGVGIAVVLIAGAAAFVFFRRRASKRGPSMPDGGHSGTANHQQAGLEGYSLQGKEVTYQRTHELGNNQPQAVELDIGR